MLHELKIENPDVAINTLLWRIVPLRIVCLHIKFAVQAINMRKVIAEIAVSLDGFIEGPEGELDWLIFDEPSGEVSAFLSRFEVIFYGRIAYEKLGVHLVADNRVSEDSHLQQTLTHMRKYVFSKQVKHVAGNGMVINDHIRERVNRIKEEEGKDIWLCGGAKIIQQFAKLGLIDEYLLAVQPVVLGSGKRLFENMRFGLDFNLADMEKLSSGVVLLKYLSR